MMFDAEWRRPPWVERTPNAYDIVSGCALVDDAAADLLNDLKKFRGQPVTRKALIECIAAINRAASSLSDGAMELSMAFDGLDQTELDVA